MSVPPSMVIIYTDDLGWGDLSCYGSTDVDTPHLDALAASGVRMTDWYSNSPVCSPSRAALLTGRHPAHAGIETILGARRDTVGLPPQTTLAGQLVDAGWDTAIFGKWHLGVEPESAPLRHGFRHHLGFRAGCVDYYSHIMYWGVRNPLHDLWDDDTEIWDNGRYLTELITDSAVAFIEAAVDPFLCYVPYNAPHYPMHAPEQYMKRFAHLPWEKQVMAAMISCVDDGVGAIVDALKRTGRLEDTIIFFSSDNGPSAEERNWLGGEEIAYPGGSTGGLRGHKGSVFEGGIRVPAIWSWPARIRPGQTCHTPAAMIDVAPTLLTAAGLGVDDSIDGIDILPQLTGPVEPTADKQGGGDPDPDEAARNTRVLGFEYEGQHAVRAGRWKLVADPSERLGAPRQPGQLLFDLDEDLAETQNLSHENPEVLERMRDHLDRWTDDLCRWRQRPAMETSSPSIPREKTEAQ